MQTSSDTEENPQEEKINRKIAIPSLQTSLKEGVISGQITEKYLDDLEQKFDSELMSEDQQQSFEQLLSESSPFFKENELMQMSTTKQIIEEIKRKNPLLVDFVQLLLTAKTNKKSSEQ